MILTLASILSFSRAYSGDPGGTGQSLATTILLMIVAAGVSHWFTRRKSESETRVNDAQADANYAAIYSEMIADLRAQVSTLQERVGSVELQVLSEQEKSRRLERYVKVLVNLLRRHEIDPPTMDEVEGDVGV